MYLPALAWMVGAWLCGYIAKKRGIKITALRTLFAVALGPLAIPFVFLLPGKTKPLAVDSRDQ